MLVLGSLFLISAPFMTNSQSSEISISQKAIKGLYDSYNKDIQLFPETSANEVYYITSDNLLAYHTIKKDYPDLASNLSNTLKAYAKEYCLPVDGDGLPISYKHEAIIGQPIGLVIKNSSYLTLPDLRVENQNRTGYIIKSEIANGTGTQALINADVIALEGLSYCNRDMRPEAFDFYNDTMDYWDGHGFADDAYTNPDSPSYHIYATYKIGLAILLSKQLGLENPTDYTEMINIIEACQTENGTIRTDYTYNGTIIPSGSANTETTAIIAIATSAKLNPTPTPIITTTPTVTPTPTPTPTTTIPTPSPTPPSSPTVPEFSWLAIILLMVSILFIAVLRRHNTNHIAL